MDYEMNDYFFGYDQYEDLPATESFVSFNMDIAEEGFKDAVKKAVTAVKGFIIKCANYLLSLLLKLARLVVNAIPHRETKEKLKAKLTVSINKCKDRIEKYKKNPSPTDNDAKQIVSEVKQAANVVATSAKNQVQDQEVKKEIVKTVKEMDNISKEMTNNKIERVEGEILTDEESKEIDKRFGLNKSKKNVVDKDYDEDQKTDSTYAEDSERFHNKLDNFLDDLERKRAAFNKVSKEIDEELDKLMM